jgi:hypothetical protein
MKFTKEEAFESLKGILTNSGKKPLRMSERSIQKQLESLMPLVANDEMELNDFIAKVKDTFSVMNSNAEKDNSDFVNQWKKEHPDQEPKPAGSSDSDNPQIKTLMDEIKAMREEMNAGKRENAIKAKRNELASALKKKGVKDEEWMSDFLSEINITEDMDVDVKADSFLKIYNRSRADVGDGASPKNASNGDTKKYKTMFEDIRKEREKMQENEKV